MIIAESLKVHDRRQETLIPALEKWLERQKELEEQKKLEELKELIKSSRK